MNFKIPCQLALYPFVVQHTKVLNCTEGFDILWFLYESAKKLVCLTRKGNLDRRSHLVFLVQLHVPSCISGHHHFILYFLKQEIMDSNNLLSIRSPNMPPYNQCTFESLLSFLSSFKLSLQEGVSLHAFSDP